MTRTEDVQNYATKFENQLEKLDGASIDERDREAIHTFVRAEDAQANVNRGTMVSNLNRLRLSAERADVPLVKMDKPDVDEFLFALKHDHGLAEGTLRNYRKALRKFVRWRLGEDSWAEDIAIGASPSTDVDPNELLTEAEVNDLLEAASNPRDKALIALLADTGLRIGAVASHRIRDLDLEGQATMVSINEDANVKDASGAIPLTWSEGYLASWLDIHPRRDDPDAAVIHKHEGYIGPGDDGNGALTYQYLSGRVKTVADDAGVARDRVNTHNFRKTAISRWIREGLSEQAIKHRACWDVDTDQIKTYSGVRDEELNEQILEHYDMAPADMEASRPAIDQCPRCHTSLRSDQHYCPGCAAPLTDIATETVDEAADGLRDVLVEEDDRDRRQAAAEMADLVESDPRLVEELLAELQSR